MNKKLVSIFLAAMLSAEPCSMVYAEDFAENISVENDVEVTEEAEQEPEETQPEQDIADNEDSEEIADIEEPETKEEEIFFDSVFYILSGTLILSSVRMFLRTSLTHRHRYILAALRSLSSQLTRQAL